MVLADAGLTVEAAMISRRTAAALTTELFVVNAIATSDGREGLIRLRMKDSAGWMLQSKEHRSYL